MRTAKRIGYTTVTVTCAVLLLSGCGKPTGRIDQGWAQPTAVAASESGLGSEISLYRYRDTIIGLNPLQNGSAHCILLNREKGSWSELPLKTLPDGYRWDLAAIDSLANRVLLRDGYAENEQLVMKAVIGTLSEDGGLRDVVERKWSVDKKALLGEIAPKVKLNFLDGNRQDVRLGLGILNGSEAWIPYCLEAAEVAHKGETRIIDRTGGPFANGVFYSADSGKTWQTEKISDFDFGAANMSSSKQYHYYFAIRDTITRNGLWNSRKPVSGGEWEPPQELVQTFANVSGRYCIASEGDTVHACWMDRRHNISRFNFDGPPIENNDIYYRRRKDTDPSWSKEVLLSKGSLYAYDPTISAEGNNVVVTWAGIRKAGKQHSDTSPNDIFYVTSKDAGQKWTKPQQVTDVAKDGITCGMPQVMLLNGVIHLLYTQGATQSRTELSPGLTKLGEGSWPIYYQQRPFPK